MKKLLVLVSIMVAILCLSACSSANIQSDNTKENLAPESSSESESYPKEIKSTSLVSSEYSTSESISEKNNTGFEVSSENIESTSTSSIAASSSESPQVANVEEKAVDLSKAAQPVEEHKTEKPSVDAMAVVEPASGVVVEPYVEETAEMVEPSSNKNIDKTAPQTNQKDAGMPESETFTIPTVNGEFTLYKGEYFNNESLQLDNKAMVNVERLAELTGSELKVSGNKVTFTKEFTEEQGMFAECTAASCTNSFVKRTIGNVTSGYLSKRIITVTEGESTGYSQKYFTLTKDDGSVVTVSGDEINSHSGAFKSDDIYGEGTMVKKDGKFYISLFTGVIWILG